MSCDDEEMKRQTQRSGHPDTQLTRYNRPEEVSRYKYSHEGGTESTGGFFPHTIQLPEEMPSQLPPELRPDDLEIQGVVELVTLDEQRREESKRRRADIPFPETIAERPPLTRFSLVGAIEINSETLLGFLSALDFIAPRQTFDSVLMSALASYETDPNGTPGSGELALEATNGAIWAQVTMKARAARQESFMFSMPIARSIAIMKLLRTQYKNVVIGMDRGEICIGPYSMPFAGLLDQFPPREPIMTGEARVALPAHYVRRIVECLVPVQAHVIEPRNFLGVHFDVINKAAVATDGARIHVLHMPDLAVETRSSILPPPAITIPPNFFDFLLAVVNRDWTAIEINETQITAVGEDFAVSSRVTVERFTDWKAELAHIPGYYLVDREDLTSFLRQAALVQATVMVETSPMEEVIFLSARGRGQESLKKTIRSQRGEGAVPRSLVAVDASHALQALESCAGGLIKLGFPRAAGDPISVRGELPDFTAILMNKEK